jgi:hypothetical protein
MMSQQAPEIVTCVDHRTHELPEVLKLFMLFLQMIAAAGGMVLLLAVQALITAWSGCALATRSLTAAGRIVFLRMCTWRQALYVFYLGSAASRPSRQEPWAGTPELVPVRAEVRVPSTSGSRMTLLECSGGDR